MGIAYAFVNSWLSVYKDRWCNYPSVQMHELGHNLGLDHSGEGIGEYSDQSGMMGYSYSSDDSPRMCFNAAKSWQLGWYADKSVSVVPPSSSTWSRRLMGIADYDNTATNTVIVKIESETELDYYVNFNQKAGINSGTLEGGDQVLITSQAAEGVAFAKSSLLAKLSAGQSYQISDFGDLIGYSLQVVVDEINLTAIPAYADITISAQIGSINSGGSDFDDGVDVWKVDTDYISDGTSSYTTPAGISNTDKQGIYQSERYNSVGGSPMVYSIPLPIGSYDIHLHLAEIYFGSAGARVFNVSMEGSVVFPDVDIFRKAGGAFAAHIESIESFPVHDGALTIEFIKIKQNPKVSGVEIHPATTPPEPTPETPSQSSEVPSFAPSPFFKPSEQPSSLPTLGPSTEPSLKPREEPSTEPSINPTLMASREPSFVCSAKQRAVEQAQ